MDSRNATTITVRLFVASDGEGISRLIYRNYDTTYYKRLYYDPDAIQKANEGKEIISIIAETEGHVIGHFAMIPSTVSNIAEIGAAVVDPDFKHQGIMNRMFDMIVATAKKKGFYGLYGEGMMLHPYSQKANLHHGMVETAILLGEVPSSMEIEHRIKDTKRSGVVLAFLLFDRQPRYYYIPKQYREIIETTCRNSHLDIAPSNLSSQSPTHALTYRFNPLLKTGTLVIDNPVDSKSIDEALKELESKPCDMLFADINLQRIARIDEMVEMLNRRRFFYGGLLLSYYHNEDYLRLQRTTETEIDEDHLVCHSPFSQNLLAFILKDEMRVSSAHLNRF